MRKKHIILIAIFVTLVIGMIAYTTIPFSKLEQIHVFREDVTPDDKVGVFIDRLLAYNQCSYVYKGLSFKDIPCNSNDGRKHTINIKFNWDNSICISENEKKFILHIDSIEFEPLVQYGVGHEGDDEYTFKYVTFFDTQQMCDSIPSSLSVYKQKSNLHYGPHRYGFELSFNNLQLQTGDENVFEY